MAVAVENPEIQPATIFIGGAGTVDRKTRYTSIGPFKSPLDIINGLHSEVTEGLYRCLGGHVVDEVIAPPNFGIGPPSLSHRLMKGILSKAIEKYDGRPIKLKGHSLGGYLALEFAHEYPDLNIEVEAWASPFGKVNGMPGVGYLFRERTNRIRKIREDMGDEAPRVTLLGSVGDRLIPPSSSLPDLPGVERLVFTDRLESALLMGVHPILVENPPGHVGILNHPDAMPLHKDTSNRPVLLSAVEII